MHLIGAFRAARHACLALLALAGAAGAGQHAGTAPGGTVAPGGADEPFVGVTANGAPVYGLYRLQETGVSTAPLAQAARAFLAALTPAQRERSTFRIDDPEWRQWTNHGHATRRGIALAEMDERARKAALDLLAASLSPAGFDRVRDIMSLASPDEGRYWMTVRGEPSATGPWGWRLEGHHLVINCFVLGDQVVLTPLSLGAGPRAGRAGSRAATDVLRQEEAGGLEMLRALSDAQRSMAILRESKDGNDAVAEASGDNASLDNVGIPAALMNEEQRARLVDLIALYVSNLREGHAETWLSQAKEHLDGTYFAWIGGDAPGSAYYYRIFSPVILIELDHRQPEDGGPPDPDHVHVVVRTPNGNDYGMELLRQHRARQSPPADAGELSEGREP